MRSVLSRKVAPRLQCIISRNATSSTPIREGVGSGSLNRRMVSSYTEDFDSDQKTALVLGSSGVLGKTLTKHLSRNLGMSVIGADVVAGEDESSLDAFVPIPTLDDKHPGLGEMTEALAIGLCEVLADGRDIDTIICAAGSWQSDPTAPNTASSDKDFIAGARSFGDNIDAMMAANLYPVLAAGYAANRFMAEEGLFVVIGATAALSPTPGMLGYGLGKSGAHHFVQTLGEISGKSATTKSRRRKARKLRQNNEYLDTLSVVGILPTTIDTPSNRESMSDHDFSQWTQPEDIAMEIGTWIKLPSMRPHSGGLVKVFPNKSGGASFNLVR
ncbi:unnamed protein product [Cylindrotheca closterium]|uniref:Uncharacterized protein n=1 Tax=Cylindrotheca closterium TaxID=2856 RepID=A0AAD2CK34_9STRA|nr:unnamed protein product [Cylindrotheca closterium]